MNKGREKRETKRTQAVDSVQTQPVSLFTISSPPPAPHQLHSSGSTSPPNYHCTWSPYHITQHVIIYSSVSCCFICVHFHPNQIQMYLEVSIYISYICIFPRAQHSFKHIKSFSGFSLIELISSHFWPLAKIDSKCHSFFLHHLTSTPVPMFLQNI